MIRRVAAALFLLVVVPQVAARILLPGLSYWKVPFIFTSAMRGNLSIAAIGIGPAISAFLVVEVVALIVPPWRRLRRGGPRERALLVRASLILTALIAVVQSYFIHQWLSSWRIEMVESPGLGSKILLVSTLTAGSFLLLAAAWLNDRVGLGSGISLLLAWEAGASLVDWILGVPLRLESGMDEPIGLFILAISGVAAVASTVWLFRRRDGGLRLPTSGVIPLPEAAWLLMLPLSLGKLFNFAVPGFPLDHKTDLLLTFVITALLGTLYARLFTRGADEEARRVALRRSLAWLMGLVALEAVPSQLHLGTKIDPLVLVVLTAVVLDLTEEWRARRREPTLVVVWPIHQTARVEPALAKLAAAGIRAHARGLHHRALLQFFGPYLPIDLMVPEERADEARALLDQPM
jgi:hypothetical protein